MCKSYVKIKAVCERKHLCNQGGKGGTLKGMSMKDRISKEMCCPKHTYFSPGAFQCRKKKVIDDGVFKKTIETAKTIINKITAKEEVEKNEKNEIIEGLDKLQNTWKKKGSMFKYFNGHNVMSFLENIMHFTNNIDFKPRCKGKMECRCHFAHLKLQMDVMRNDFIDIDQKLNESKEIIEKENVDEELKKHISKKLTDLDNKRKDKSYKKKKDPLIHKVLTDFLSGFANCQGDKGCEAILNIFITKLDEVMIIDEVSTRECPNAEECDNNGAHCLLSGNCSNGESCELFRM